MGTTEGATPTETDDGRTQTGSDEDTNGGDDPDGQSIPDGELAAYDGWVLPGEITTGGMSAATVDIVAIRETDDSEESGTFERLRLQDPLLGTAVDMFRQASKIQPPFGETVFAAPADAVHLVGTGEAVSQVFTGSFDADAIAATLTDDGGEQVGTHDGYRLFDTTADDNERRELVAVGGEVVLRIRSEAERDALVEQAGARLDAGTAADSPDRTDDGYRRLATALPRRDQGTIEYAPDGTYSVGDTDTGIAASRGIDLEGDILGLATSTTFGAASVEATVALLYADESGVDDESILAEEIGWAASERSIAVADRMVFVEGTYVPNENDGQ